MKPDNNAKVRADFIDLVPRNAARILDAGCGKGLVSKRLKERGVKETVGVEVDADKGKEAAKVMDKVIIGDIEKIELPFTKNYFDCILYGDILEHLRDPWALIKKHRALLKEGGCVICSIPNVRYYKIIRRLMLGYWDYTDAGPMDKSHLRFFGLINVKEMFDEAGYEITNIVNHIVTSRGMRIFNSIFLNKFKDFLTYQYYIVAKKTDFTGPKKRRKIPAF